MNNKNLSIYAIMFIFIALCFGVFLKKPKINPLDPNSTFIQSDGLSKEHSSISPENESTKVPPPVLVRKMANSGSENNSEIKYDFDRIVQKKKNEQLRNAVNIKPSRLIKHDLFSNSNWRIWPQITAIKNHSPLQENDQIIGKLSGYQLIKTNSEISSIEQFDLKNPIVLYDEKMQRPAVLTGVLVALAEDRHDLENCALKNSVIIRDAFENINTYILSSDMSHFNLAILKNEIAHCPSVKNVRLEILDRPYEKK